MQDSALRLTVVHFMSDGEGLLEAGTRLAPAALALSERPETIEGHFFNRPISQITSDRLGRNSLRNITLPKK